jgi:hypothetical protein
MKSERLDATKAIRAIQNLVNDLLNLFLFCKSKNDELGKLRVKLDDIDKNNPEYYEILHDRRENTKMNFRFIVLLLSFFVDFFLLHEALIILCNQFGWCSFLKFIVPIILIIIEIAISYFSILNSRDEARSSHLGRNLQYFVLPILVGFSLLAIFYHIQSYNVEIDAVSLLSFMSFHIIIQIVLLISSIMLHLWLIKHAEDIAETIAYIRYKYERGRIVSEIERIENVNTLRHYPQFTKLTHKYVKDTDAFDRKFPDMNMNFALAMPQDLIDGINNVMGRIVIAPIDNSTG